MVDRALGDKICELGRLCMRRGCVYVTEELVWEILIWHITINHSKFVICFCLEFKNCSWIELSVLLCHDDLQIRFDQEKIYKECKLNKHMSSYVLVARTI